MKDSRNGTVRRGGDWVHICGSSSPILTSQKALQCLGGRSIAPNAPKFYPSHTVLSHAENLDWLHRAQKILTQINNAKNASRATRSK